MVESIPNSQSRRRLSILYRAAWSDPTRLLKAARTGRNLAILPKYITDYSSKGSKENFRVIIYGINRNPAFLIDSFFTSSNAKAKEVFNSGEVKRE